MGSTKKSGHGHGHLQFSEVSICETSVKQVMSWGVYATSGSYDKELSLDGGFAEGDCKVIL